MDNIPKLQLASKVNNNTHLKIAYLKKYTTKRCFHRIALFIVQQILNINRN